MAINLFSIFKVLIRKVLNLVKLVYVITLFKIKYPFVPFITPFKFNKLCYLTYYSQTGQDLYISSLLFNILTNSEETCYIVDIGCNHPEHFSNSLFLEKYFGCKTIAIDPIHEFQPLWSSMRPDAKFICAAIGELEQQTNLEIAEDSMFSALEGSRSKHTGNLSSNRLVEVVKLSTILKSLGINRVLLIAIDVEGFEMEVLKSIDFDSVEIKCFLIENNSQNLMGSEDIRNFLYDRGFILYARFGYLDDLFVKNTYHPSIP